MDQDFKAKFEKANDILALKGERVIGCAYNKLDQNRYGLNYDFIKVDKSKPADAEEGEEYITDIPIDNLVFVGLIAMEDPPR